MTPMLNSPVVKIGVIGVSRDCFPITLTGRRLDEVARALKKTKVDFHRCSVVVENEIDAQKALAEVRAKKCNAIVIYLGNFGPEGPSSFIAQTFGGPVMACAAAEENRKGLAADRGDALCGLLNLSYNLGLRKVRAYIPQSPVVLPAEAAAAIVDFERIARVVIGVKALKIFAFGPRPHDFLACNAPIKPFYDLGVEVMENSELDLLQIYKGAEKRKKEIEAVAAAMKKELGKGNTYPDLLPKLAQFEVGLMEFLRKNLGKSEFAVFANKCWPAFEGEFRFVPCFVNSRLAGQGIPVACEVDMYGALSEYMVQLATLHPATLLDINNSVPADILPPKTDLKGAVEKDLFMGFHCGNTCSSCMKECKMNYQVIMNRLMEPAGQPPDITRGTLEGQLKPGAAVMFRLQSTPDCHLQSYIADGEMLDVDPATFGGTGVIAIKDFGRFYRHVLVGKRYPHHAAVGFKKGGRILFEAVKLLGVDDISVPLPPAMPYPGENPFETFLA